MYDNISVFVNVIGLLYSSILFSNSFCKNYTNTLKTKFLTVFTGILAISGGKSTRGSFFFRLDYFLLLKIFTAFKMIPGSVITVIIIKALVKTMSTDPKNKSIPFEENMSLFRIKNHNKLIEYI